MDGGSGYDIFSGGGGRDTFVVDGRPDVLSAEGLYAPAATVTDPSRGDTLILNDYLTTRAKSELIILDDGYAGLFVGQNDGGSSVPPPMVHLGGYGYDYNAAFTTVATRFDRADAVITFG